MGHRQTLALGLHIQRVVVGTQDRQRDEQEPHTQSPAPQTAEPSPIAAEPGRSKVCHASSIAPVGDWINGMTLDINHLQPVYVAMADVRPERRVVGPAAARVGPAVLDVVEPRPRAQQAPVELGFGRRSAQQFELARK